MKRERNKFNKNKSNNKSSSFQSSGCRKKKRSKQYHHNSHHQESSSTSNSATTSTAHRDLPGYYYDEKTNRYFKIDKQIEAFRQLSVDPNANTMKESLICEQLESKSLPLLLLNSVGVNRSNRIDVRSFKKRSTQTLLNYTVGRTEMAFQSKNVINAHSSNVCFLNDHVFLSSWRQSPSLQYLSESDQLAGASELNAGNNMSEVVNILYSSMFNVALFCATNELRMAKFKLDTTPIAVTDFEKLFGCEKAEHSLYTCSWTQTNNNHYYDNLMGFSNDALLSIGCTKGGVLLDLTTQKVIARIPTSNSDVFTQVFDSNNLIWNGCRDGLVRIFDIKQKPSKSRQQSIKCSSSVISMAMVPQSSILITCSAQGQISSWDKRKLETPLLTYQQASPNLIEFAKLSLVPCGQNNHLVVFPDNHKGDRILGWNESNGQLLMNIECTADDSLISVCTTTKLKSYYSLKQRHIVVARHMEYSSHS